MNQPYREPVVAWEPVADPVREAQARLVHAIADCIRDITKRMVDCDGSPPTFNSDDFAQSLEALRETYTTVCGSAE